jgi:predicted AAA+ superfamily ATPase
MVALRTGQIVNYDDLARDVGVSAVTIKEWLGVLESSFIVRLVHPYHWNKTKRLIKSPKVYFLDMGLAAHLSGWRGSNHAQCPLESARTDA